MKDLPVASPAEPKHRTITLSLLCQDPDCRQHVASVHIPCPTWSATIWCQRCGAENHYRGLPIEGIEASLLQPGSGRRR